MRPRIVILGGGHGLAAVARALRDRGQDLTVVVSVADDGGSSGELRRRWGGPAVGDIRRTFIALVGEGGRTGRALAAPVIVAGLGRHPLGNLLLFSLSRAFGDLEAASAWLANQLGITARVLPATTEPVVLIADGDGGVVHGESAIGTARSRITRIMYEPARPAVATGAIDAVEGADWVLLAPGSLFTSVLAVAALPDIVAALRTARGRVLWICNLQAEVPETVGMSAVDHLALLRSHGVRVDAALFDPMAGLHLSPSELDAAGIDGRGHRLMSRNPARHDPRLLGAALEVFCGVPSFTG